MRGWMLAAVISLGCSRTTVQAPQPVAPAVAGPVVSVAAPVQPVAAAPAVVEGERALQEALARDPGDASAWEGLARLYLERSATAPGYVLLTRQVIAQGREALAQRGKVSADLQVTQGQLALAEGKPDVARRALEAALQVDPKHPRALAVVGQLALEVRDAAAAQRALATLVALPAGRDDPEAWLALGVAERALKRYAAAEAAYQRVLVLAPDDPRPHFNLAQLHEHRMLAIDEMKRGRLEAVTREHYARFLARSEGDPRYAAQRRLAAERREQLAWKNPGCCPRLSEELEKKASEYRALEAKMEEWERERVLELERRTLEEEARDAAQ